jgi:hypothetical protein
MAQRGRQVVAGIAAGAIVHGKELVSSSLLVAQPWSHLGAVQQQLGQGGPVGAQGVAAQVGVVCSSHSTKAWSTYGQPPDESVRPENNKLSWHASSLRANLLAQQPRIAAEVLHVSAMGLFRPKIAASSSPLPVLNTYKDVEEEPRLEESWPPPRQTLSGAHRAVHTPGLAV